MNKWTKNKKIRKDYQAKNLKNPFFRQKEQGSSSRSWRLPLFLFIISLISLLWLFFAAPWWQLEEIRIQGLTRASQDSLIEIVQKRAEESRWLVFRESNIFLLNKEAIINQINEEYNFAKIEIRKIIPNVLEIKISERPYAFIFQEGSSLSYASSDGYLIQDVPVKEEDLNKYFILENRSLAVTIGSKNKLTLKQDYLDFVFALQSELSKQPDLLIERFIIDQELNSLSVKFKDGPTALFNIKNNAGEQANDLALVKKEKIRDNFSATKYIDLRYGNRIFIN